MGLLFCHCATIIGKFIHDFRQFLPINDVVLGFVQINTIPTWSNNTVLFVVISVTRLGDFYYLGDFKFYLAIIFGEKSPKFGRVLDNFWNGTTFWHLGHYDLSMGYFLPRPPIHTGSDKHLHGTVEPLIRSIFLYCVTLVVWNYAFVRLVKRD